MRLTDFAKNKVTQHRYAPNTRISREDVAAVERTTMTAKTNERALWGGDHSLGDSDNGNPAFGVLLLVGQSRAETGADLLGSQPVLKHLHP